MKKALVIGAGPAGLTAAYELLTKSEDMEVMVFEESDCFGGIPRPLNIKETVWIWADTAFSPRFLKLTHGGIKCSLCRALQLMMISF